MIRTHLTPAGVSQTRAHSFDDTGAEFEHMMEGSLHPLGQNGRCGCSSNVRLVDCCLAYLSAEDCPCGSGKKFVDCCRVSGPPTAVPTPHASQGPTMNEVVTDPTPPEPQLQTT